MRKTFAQILEEGVKADKDRIAAKLPHWSEFELEYPGKLSLEQCSGETAALYKAKVLLSSFATAEPAHLRIADLTGGLGVDCWAFARSAGAVFYNERNIELREAAERNFSKLGVANVEFHSFDISEKRSGWTEALQEFSPDCIYLDPARRGAHGQKVFRPEDCQPDILGLLPILRKITPHIMVKLSPMADIALLQERLGEGLREIKVVEASCEVKELLCIFGPDAPDEPLVTVVSLGQQQEWSFLRSEESESPVRFTESISGGCLLEPRPAVLKAGAFRLCCRHFNLSKLAPSTHLYHSPGQHQSGPFFKVFKIHEVLPMSKDNLTQLGKKYPHAEVSARNIPLRSEELRRRMGVTEGDPQGIHIFGCTCGPQKILIVSSRI